VGYKDLLTRSLDFLHLFLRCSDALILPKEVIKTLWESIASHAATTEEANLMVNFLTRLVLRNLSPSPSSTTPLVPILKGSSCIPCTTEGISPTLSSKGKRKSVCSSEVVQWVFEELLCDSRFISSLFFTTQAFACTERLFRWLNTEAGLLVELKGQG
jgi:hypothetical protein